jgi:hypothetical protein
MFTLLPSLYFIGVHYFRQWKSPYYYEKFEKQESISKTSNDQSQKVKTRRKKFNYRRRKTSINELNHDDTIYLINETGFTREEILAWYIDFLVCIFRYNKCNIYLIFLSVIVQMENFRKVNSLIFIKHFIKKVK